MHLKFNPFTGQLDLVDTGGAGGTTNSIIITKTAGETISALKAVYVKLSDGLAYVASSAATNVEALVIGIAISSGNAGDLITIVTSGEVVDAGWSWSSNGEVYLSSNGSVTTTVPSDNYHVVLGKILTNNSIAVAIEPSIKL